jgi:hypothetical protein
MPLIKALFVLTPDFSVMVPLCLLHEAKGKSLEAKAGLLPKNIAIQKGI